MAHSPCYNIDIRDEENKSNLTPKQNNKWLATYRQKGKQK